MDVLGAVRALVAPVLTRVKLLAQRAVVRASDDAPRAATLSLAVLAREQLARVERFAHYGFTSRPPTGSEAIVLCLGGNRDHPVVVADEDRRERPAGGLAEGEVCVYAAGGARVYLRADGSVEIVAPGGVLVSGDVEVDGDLGVSGNVTAAGDVADGVGTLAALRSAYNVHVHSDPQGGSTGPPVPTV